MSGVRMRNGSTLPLADVPLLAYDSYATALSAAVAAGGRIAASFAAAVAGAERKLLTVVADDHSGELLLLRTRIGSRFPSLTPQLPQLQLFEREIAEQYGALPTGHPWLKPLRFHPLRAEGTDAWGRKERPLPGEMDYFRIAGEEVHEVAVGPVHAGVIEPGHFRFQCHGEEVMHLEISLGYQHRDIERTLAGGPHAATAARMETLAGDTTIGHMSAYCQLLEGLSGCEISPRAATLRAVALELERLANHVGDIGALANDVGFLPTASFCGRLRGDYLNMSAALCGSRFGRTLVRPGGVAHDCDANLAAELLGKLGPVARDTRGALELFFETPSVLARLEGTGKVSRDDALALGLVGMAARASGVERDARWSHPLGAYGAAGVSVVVEEGGDVFARAAVRRHDIERSLGLVGDWLEALPAGPLRQPCGPLAPEHLAVSLVEGWRGEIVHVALTDAAGRFNRYKVVDPSFRNWNGLALALRGEEISDFPLCNKSFNLSYCGFDL